MRHLIRLFTSLLLAAISGCVGVPEAICRIDIQPMSPLPGPLAADFSQVPRQNIDRQQSVWQLLESAGCDSLKREPLAGSRFANIVCQIDGTLSDYILVGAHHDRTGAGRGVVDNWTGVEILAALARYHAGQRPVHTLRFVAFAQEEQDLDGARQHLRQLRKEHQPLPRVMVNIDTIGLDSLAVDRRGDHSLNCLAESLAVTQGEELRQTRIRDMTGDWVPFRYAGVPVISFHSLKAGDMSSLHTFRDRESLLNRSLLESSYQVIAQTLSAIDYAVDLTVRN
ncbi:MAG: M28 family peptidase [Proteobacteria bacterium]|nr:M28 family peptidase [Pseudomonadota bacterium]